VRVDAQRNHDHILAVAADLFAGAGVKVGIDEIARAAGVGVGTIHRHFPTKDDLIEAVLVVSCQPILAALDDALADPDPGAGLERFFYAMLEYQSAHRALAEEMREAHDRSPELADIKAVITERLAMLVAKAQATGHIRPDIGAGDLRLIFIGLAQTATAAGTTITHQEKVRFVRIVLDGLRSPLPTPLPGDAPTL
jgi:AcrR family transcriptional regulator